MNSWSSPLGGSIKIATRFEMPLCTRSAASSAPAPPDPGDTTMMSADTTGSFTTSAHPAARRTGSRRERTATIENAANATTTTIGAHLRRREIILGFIRLLHESAMSPAGEHWPCSAKMSSPCWHKCEGRTASCNVRVQGQSGKHELALSPSQFGPAEALTASNGNRSRCWFLPYQSTRFSREDAVSLSLRSDM